ncbi:iron-dependent peroxidase [Paenibacillus sp. MER TA 81-3]|uniref:iron-dependent peroxidase n=1 Tax=Paenibacillus sp. MER TA 81-3 TaxID=2939573 RepID=UPI00203AC28F|nr:iron-dependent peroxidase [Paenibacillus sp. MER TA 81-3]MCM3340831.1 iron-dependent peroxidase [Paenibacillus sp. MER TA 81-3]
MGVNYIWDLIIKAEQSGLNVNNIRFAPAKVYSPYMELSLEDLNARTVEQQVEVNPYYRFYDLFKDMFDINNEEDVELRNTLFDIVLHFLTGIDRVQGMNRREYYIKFVLRDMEEGRFGARVSEGIKLFDREEREAIAGNVLRLYETGEAVYLLKDTLRDIFRCSTIYANCEDKDELLFYVGQEETDTARAKLELIKELFLPARFHTEVYWRDHFGIIDVDDTMRLGGISLY